MQLYYILIHIKYRILLLQRILIPISLAGITTAIMAIKIQHQPFVTHMPDFSSTTWYLIGFSFTK